MYLYLLNVSTILPVLVALGAIGVALVSIGLMLNDDIIWLIADTYSIVAFACIAILAIIIRQTLTKQN